MRVDQAPQNVMVETGKENTESSVVARPTIVLGRTFILCRPVDLLLPSSLLPALFSFLPHNLPDSKIKKKEERKK